ncbi:HAMP domain-containing protein [Cohnella sp. CFH 77786]|uniref:cache domain-containing sensor histidine kinase n=1 Tax=Cohnella sp. CFH 77786 TaxID=2662265 RepID=UPI001C60ED27|nr:sensor histidine kinase [Cohnella sp. CFH 77786]MBW5447204.1 HAMP domain-containing protein [Cohnella sp. CFH 77786]
MTFTGAYRNLKLKHKLLIFNSLLILVTLGTLAYISYRESAKTLNSEILYSTKQVFAQTDNFLSYKLSKIIDVSDAIALDGNLNDYLSRPESEYGLPAQLRDFQNLSLNLSSFQKNDDIYRIRLFIPDYLIYANERMNFFPLSEFASSALNGKLLGHTGKMMWISDGQAIPSLRDPEQKTVHSIRFIKNFSRLDDKIGVLDVDIRLDVLQDIVKRANTSRGGAAYLQNADGLVVAASNDSRAADWRLPPGTAAEIAGQADPWRQLTIRGESVLAGAKNIRGTDWTLVSIVPLKEVYSLSNRFRNQIILSMVLLALAANLFGYWISSSMTARIGIVIRKMRKVQSGELDTVKLPATKDEIGELVENFNYMVGRMKVFIDEQYKLGQEAKSSELKALQSQINPHFLYNTLDLINWMAIQRSVPEISSLVASLSRFYKLSLNKGEEIISVADELTHVKLYVEIQNKRFSDAVSLHIDVDESVGDCRIPKITLQPIVENAILHGIREKSERKGVIFIYSYPDSEDMILVIQDNGVGIPEELVEAFNRGDSPEKTDGGYGVKNINHRLKLYYGEQYGLRFESQVGVGTSVEIRIPATGAGMEDDAE